jgi:hypothetical protein
MLTILLWEIWQMPAFISIFIAWKLIKGLIIQYILLEKQNKHLTKNIPKPSSFTETWTKGQFPAF